MAEGRSNAAIAERLCVSEKAVVRHASNIYDELGLDAEPPTTTAACWRSSGTCRADGARRRVGA